MCGITAYIGDKEAFPILISGLERLEYRGYDSAGVATLNVGEGGARILKLNKAVGKVANLKTEKLPGSIGLAHTRWATHGAPTQANAHPHHNDEQSIVLVHNGIIENYAVLRKKLQEKGYSFYSQTDTEVLTKLIDYFSKKEKHKGDFRGAVVAALHEVVGAYGIVILNKSEDKLYAARKGSPLCLGIGQGEYFIASDPAAFLEHTRRVLYLEEDDVVVVDRKSFSVSNICEGHDTCVDRDVTHIEWDLSSVEKNGYEHFMLKEIFEQADSIKNCIAGRTDLDHTVAELKTKLPESFLKNLGKVVIAACGTSWHAAQVAKFVIEKYCRVPVEVEYASEFRYKNPIFGQEDLFMVISQSGETADTLAALKEAKERGVRSYGIVNVVGSSIAREVDAGTYIRAGPEIGVASTKAFTGQVVALLLFAIALGRIKETLSVEKAQEMIHSLEDVPSLVAECLLEAEKIKKIAEGPAFISKHSAFFLGRGVHVPTALEGSLKLKEISYIHSEAFPSGEMKHGPIALLDPGFPVVTMLADNDLVYEKILSNIQEVKARSAYVIAVANKGDQHVSEIADALIRVPKVADYLQPVIFSVPLQLLAYYVALARGCAIDQPKNLAKSVTVE